MKKMILAVAAVGVTSFADVTKKAFKDMTPEERAAWGAERMAERYRKTGGEVVKPGSRKGSVAIVSQQTTLPDAEIEKILELLRKDNNITYVAVKGTPGTKPIEAVRRNVCGRCHRRS